MLMKLFACWKGLLFWACWEINTKYQITHFGMKPFTPFIWNSLWFPSQRSVALQFLSVLVYFQGLPTITVSPHYGLHCPLRTTTTPYPTSLPTAWTETPWEGDATPFTPPLRALETDQPPQSRSSYKTAGCSTVTSRWRPGQTKWVPLCYFFFSVFTVDMFTWC